MKKPSPKPGRGGLGAALVSSLHNEETARERSNVPKSLEDRFARAESAFDTPAPTDSPADPPPSAKKPPAPTEKVVRDTFSMPKGDYALIEMIMGKCLKGGVAVNKSEVVRAGLQVLNELPVKALRDAVRKVEKIKTGRPKR